MLIFLLHKIWSPLFT